MRHRARAGLVPLTDEEFDLAVGLQGAALDPEAARLVDALLDAVRTDDAEGRGHALADLRAECDRRGVDL